MSEWICACYNMSITIISTISGPSRMCLKKQSKNNNNKNPNSGGERRWGRAEAEKKRKNREMERYISVTSKTDKPTNTQKQVINALSNDPVLLQLCCHWHWSTSSRRHLAAAHLCSRALLRVVVFSDS